jgi:hypothetical protein
MAEVDTSSYNLPVRSLSENVADIQGMQQRQQQIQSGGLTIDKQKLDLANQGFQYLSRALTSLGPDATKEDLMKVGQDTVKMGLVPPQAYQTWIQRVDAAPSPQKFIQDTLHAVDDHSQSIAHIIGTPTTMNDNTNQYTGVQKQSGEFIPKTAIPTQLPPNQPIVGNDLRPGVIGPSGPAGPRPMGLPTGASVPLPVARRAPGGLPVASAAPPAVSGPTGPTVSQGTDFNNRFSAAFPNAIPTGAAPGEQSAAETVGKQSGQDLATDLTRAKKLQADLYPIHQVLGILKEEGPQAFGQGTDALNVLKNAMITWFPNVDPKTIQSVSNFEVAKKQLVNLARTSGNTGTNDQLATAIEGSPNTKMSGATIETVLKSIAALRKMESAQTLMAVKEGVPRDQYSTWIATHQNQFDPRAFAVDDMSADAKSKLMASLAKDKKAYQKFEKTLQFAHDAELVGQ